MSERPDVPGGVEVVCREGMSGLGPNMALGLLDLSAGRARLVVWDTLTVGQVVEVCLYPDAGQADFRRAARVTSSRLGRGGLYLIELEFETPLTPESQETLRRLRR
jgi:hypothetical protein